jgi:hypothetical protein
MLLGLPPSAADSYLSLNFRGGPSVSEPRKHHYVPVCYLMHSPKAVTSPLGYLQ